MKRRTIILCKLANGVGGEIIESKKSIRFSCGPHSSTAYSLPHVSVSWFPPDSPTSSQSNGFASPLSSPPAQGKFVINPTHEGIIVPRHVRSFNLMCRPLSLTVPTPPLWKQRTSVPSFFFLLITHCNQKKKAL